MSYNKIKDVTSQNRFPDAKLAKSFAVNNNSDNSNPSTADLPNSGKRVDSQPNHNDVMDIIANARKNILNVKQVPSDTLSASPSYIPPKDNNNNNNAPSSSTYNPPKSYLPISEERPISPRARAIINGEYSKVMDLFASIPKDSPAKKAVAPGSYLTPIKEPLRAVHNMDLTPNKEYETRTPTQQPEPYSAHVPRGRNISPGASAILAGNYAKPEDPSTAKKAEQPVQPVQHVLQQSPVYVNGIDYTKYLPPGARFVDEPATHVRYADEPVSHIRYGDEPFTQYRYVDEPVRYVDEPVHYADEPVRYVDEPIRYVDNYPNYVDEPVRYVGEPRYVDEPIRYVGEPRYVDEPIRYVDNYPSYVSSYENLDQVPHRVIPNAGLSEKAKEILGDIQLDPVPIRYVDRTYGAPLDNMSRTIDHMNDLTYQMRNKYARINQLIDAPPVVQQIPVQNVQPLPVKKVTADPRPKRAVPVKATTTHQDDSSYAIKAFIIAMIVLFVALLVAQAIGLDDTLYGLK